jgi:hypothetical protein
VVFDVGCSLDLSYNPIGDKGVRRIIHALRNNDLTESINLAGTQMGPAAAKEVYTYLLSHA